MFYDNAYNEKAKNISEKNPQLKAFAFFKDSLKQSNAVDIPCNYTINKNKTAVIIYTSGTTGTSKGVMLSHENLCDSTIWSYLSIMGHDYKRDTVLSILPPHHVFGLVCGILCPIYSGIPICISSNFKYIEKNMQDFKPSMLLVVPSIVENMRNKILLETKREKNREYFEEKIKMSKSLTDIAIKREIFKDIINMFGGKLRTIICGGAYINQELISFFDCLGINVLVGYGLTECSSNIACNRIDKKKYGSVGVIAPKPYCEIKVSHEKEILVRGSLIMKGYFNDDIATKEIFDDNWLKTGDLGYIDGDGFLYITGRKKNLIILEDGNNISPDELEKEIQKIPLVKDVIVYAKKGIRKNSILTALIYPNNELAGILKISDLSVKIEEEINKLNNNLPRYKQIHLIELSNKEFDKTSIGKVKRYKYFEEE